MVLQRLLEAVGIGALTAQVLELPEEGIESGLLVLRGLLRRVGRGGPQEEPLRAADVL
eukprot:CAMPEP_0180559028 /NCGR_PEP_ID=MMETSP1037_2-20121125/2072_1 /TAXON_ID=632150 /ORGANISM="Azadinium spinosum, Strain 3D9" /LENGTH=57 /DNA_ID=CAMNT_0022575461 /DNA_START=335 /DNA_END=504 /DNA_ORIENTATION=+